MVKNHGRNLSTAWSAAKRSTNNKPRLRQVISWEFTAKTTIGARNHGPYYSTYQHEHLHGACRHSLALRTWVVSVFARRSGVHFWCLALRRVSSLWYLIERRRLAGIILVFHPTKADMSHGVAVKECKRPIEGSGAMVMFRWAAWGELVRTSNSEMRWVQKQGVLAGYEVSPPYDLGRFRIAKPSIFHDWRVLYGWGFRSDAEPDLAFICLLQVYIVETKRNSRYILVNIFNNTKWETVEYVTSLQTASCATVAFY